jgi:tetratricopeptide (TPR) repeat protein
MHHVPDYLLDDWKKAYASNDFETLLQRVKEEYTKHPEEKQYLIPLHAMCNRLTDRWEENIVFCREAIPELTIQNSYKDTMQELAGTYEKMGNKQAVAKVYEEMYEREPHSFWATQAAETYEEMGNKEMAMHYYMLDAEDTDDVDVFEKLAKYFEEKQDYDKAYMYLEKAAIAQPDEGGYWWCEAGRMLAMAGKTEDAMFHFKMVLKLKPDSASAYYFMGKIYHDKGDIYLAMHNYHKALELDPDYGEAYNNLGVIQYYEEGDIKKAIEFMLKALETDVKNSTKTTLYLNLTRLYKQIADYDKQEYYHAKFMATIFSLDDDDEDEDDDADEEDYDEDEDDEDDEEEDL